MDCFSRSVKISGDYLDILLNRLIISTTAFLQLWQWYILLHYHTTAILPYRIFSTATTTVSYFYCRYHCNFFIYFSRKPSTWIDKILIFFKIWFGKKNISNSSNSLSKRTKKEKKKRCFSNLVGLFIRNSNISIINIINWVSYIL